MMKAFDFRILLESRRAENLVKKSSLIATLDWLLGYLLAHR